MKSWLTSSVEDWESFIYIYSTLCFFLYLLLLRLLPYFVCCEHWFTNHCLNPCFQLFGVYNYKWNCWTTVYNIFYGNAILFPQSLLCFIFPQTVFKDCNFFTCSLTLIFLHFLKIIAILISLRSNLILSFICMCLMISDIKDLLCAYQLIVCLMWRNCPFTSFTDFQIILLS